MQQVERMRQLTRAELDKEDKRELAVQFHRAMVRLLQQNVDCLRRELDQFEETLNAAAGQEEELVSRLLSEAEKKLGAKIDIEKRLAAGRFKVRFLRPNGRETSLIVDSNKLAGFRLDRWFWDSAVPWVFQRWPEFLADMDRGNRMLENVKEGGRRRAENCYERNFERNLRWKNEVNELVKKGKSIRSACRFIGDRDGENKETIRKTVSRS